METTHEEARIARLMEHYRCSREDVRRYLDLREEGYSQYQAAVMAGISDPQE
jgi:hypothetical protein